MISAPEGLSTFLCEEISGVESGEVCVSEDKCLAWCALSLAPVVVAEVLLGLIGLELV